ncbi:MAG: endonuclease [Paludibacteraceae bacterium]
MKKILVSFCLGIISVAALWAQPSETYYSSANGKSDDALRKALMAIIDDHTIVSYDDLKELYKYSDTKENDADTRNMIIDIYSECTYTPGSEYCASVDCGGYNREHSVPKSWFNKASPMYSDAFHLYPTSCYVNSYRGNNALGECSGGEKCTTNGMTEALGRRGSCTYPGYSALVYEPDDKYKGDLARTYFYMATRYADQCSSWSGGMFGSDNNGFQTWAINMLLEWHRADPVSEKEKIRNEAIFGNTKYNTGAYSQGNRNPFIDYPCLAEYIWGNRKGEQVDFSKILSTYSQDYAETSDLSGCTCALTDPTIIAPQNASTFEVGSANIGEKITKVLTVKGVLLTQNLSLTISGTNAALFAVTPASITSTAALAGAAVTVSYTPQSLGNHTATLTIGSDETTAVVVTLIGKCEAALVSPTTDGLLFVADNVADKYSQTVELKGTNLSSNVSLSVSGTHAAMFAVSAASATAAEVNDGKFVTVSYQPTALGTHTATLVVSSPDFATVNVPLTGSCSFSALDATNITKNSFTANWTNGGVSGYTLDVFKQEVTGVAEVTLLEDACNKATTATTGGSVNYDIEDCVRLGSGSKVGSLTYKNLDLSKGGSVVVNAKYYNTDEGTQMKITAGSVSQTFTLTNAFADYVLPVAAAAENTSVSVVIESLEGGKRVNVNNVKVIGGGEAITNVSLSGYPKQVGNLQSYTVVGLEPNTEYYYNVTPDGVAVSEDIAVTTLEGGTATAIEYSDAEGLVYYTDRHLLHVINLCPGTSLAVFDCTGRLVEQRTADDDTETFALPNGLYLVRVQANGEQRTLKIAL